MEVKVTFLLVCAKSNCWFVLFERTSEGQMDLCDTTKALVLVTEKHYCGYCFHCQVNDTQAALAVPQTQAVIQCLA